MFFQEGMCPQNPSQYTTGIAYEMNSWQSLMYCGYYLTWKKQNETCRLQALNNSLLIWFLAMLFYNSSKLQSIKLAVLISMQLDIFNGKY